MTKKKDLVHCFDCNQICCRTTVVEVEAPKSTRDYSDLLFYLYHCDTELVIAKNGKKKEWYVEFMSPCKFLVEGRCAIYEHRPLVCREYDMDSCERNRAKSFTYIRSPEEFFDYLEKKGPGKMYRKLRKTHLPPGGYPFRGPSTAANAVRTRVNRSEC